MFVRPFVRPLFVIKASKTKPTAGDRILGLQGPEILVDKKVHQNKWNHSKRGKVPTSTGVTHANEVYEKKLQKAPTSAVVSYTEMVKWCQCTGKQKHKVKHNVRHYPNHKSPTDGRRPRRF